MPTVLIVTFLVYVAIRIGTDPVASFLRANTRATEEDVQEYIEANGLYEGFGGYVRGYFTWLGGFLTGDWPHSIKGEQPVWPNLQDAMANSLRLAGIGALIGIVVGCTLGVFAALKPGGLRDGSVNTTALVMLSIPPFVSAIILQMVFAVYTREWFPEASVAALPDVRRVPAGPAGLRPAAMLEHLVLPVTVVAIQSIAVYTRYMRASLLDVLNSDYLRTARSKGDQRAPSPRQPRHAQRHAADRDAGGDRLRAAVRRSDHHREHLRVPGHGQVLPHRVQQRRLPRS